MKKLLFSLMFVLSLCSIANAAGTLTQTDLETIKYGGKERTPRYKLTMPWTSDASAGTVSVALNSANISRLKGKFISHAVTDPGATAPTDNYDIAINDEDNNDIFGGALNNRDTANSEQATPLVGGAYRPVLVNGALTVSITNAGNSKTGTLILYIF